MKGLALSQPWAELVISGRKKIEIRNKNTSYRGWFYVYASRKDSIDSTIKSFNYENLPTGVIIGKAFLSDVKKYTAMGNFKEDVKLHLATEKEMLAEGWSLKMPKYGYIISKAERIEPIPFRGLPGLFEVNI